jgi:hypothetical protein
MTTSEQVSNSAEQAQIAKPAEQVSVPQANAKPAGEPKGTLKAAFDVAYAKAKTKENNEPNLNKEPNAERKTDSVPPVVEQLEPKQSWSDEQKAWFAKHDADGKKVMLKYYEDWDKGYHKRLTEVDKEVKFAKALKEVFAPFEPHWKQAGVEPTQKVRDLIILEQQFAANPAQFISDLYRQAVSTGRVRQDEILKLLGINAPQDDGMQAEPNVNDLVAQLENKFENRLSSFEKRIMQEKVAKVQTQVSEFFTQKDAQGNPKYPHFERLEPLMSKAAQLTGESDLDKLYNDALMLDPELRQGYIDTQLKSKADEYQKQRDLEKARTASFGLSSSPNANVNIPRRRELKDIVAENAKKHFG